MPSSRNSHLPALQAERAVEGSGCIPRAPMPHRRRHRHGDHEQRVGSRPIGGRKPVRHSRAGCLGRKPASVMPHQNAQHVERAGARREHRRRGGEAPRDHDACRSISAHRCARGRCCSECRRRYRRYRRACVARPNCTPLSPRSFIIVSPAKPMLMRIEEREEEEDGTRNQQQMPRNLAMTCRSGASPCSARAAGAQ